VADLSKLKKKVTPLLVAAGGTTFLMVGLAGCNTTPTTSGNLIAPDVVEQDTQKDVVDPPMDWVSGNLLPPDISDLVIPDDGPSPEDWFSGNLMPPDVTEEDVAPDAAPDVPEDFWTSGNLMPPDITEMDATGKDAGTDAGTDTQEEDIWTSGNLMPPDIMEMDAKPVPQEDTSDSNK